jgi:signal transduction histidine kinase
MEFLKEKNRQQAIKMLAVCLLICMIWMVAADFFIYKSYCLQVNKTMSDIILEIEKNYPKVQRTELVRILNETQQNNSVDLSDFGIEKNTVNVIKNMKKCFYHGLFYSLPVLVCFGILAAAVVFFYFLRENKKIGEITGYIQAINQKKYDLCLLDNEEGAISQLKNELYKITVMLKEEAEKSRREKEAVKEAMADISHQMKTPMTSVLVLLDNLLEEESMSETVRQQFLAEINRQVQWVNSLVISMLKLSRLSAGVVKMNRERIDLSGFFKEIREKLLILMEMRNVSVRIEENEEMYFEGDRYWEQEAMSNFLKNAVEHTKDGGTVTVSFEKNYFYTKILIADEGEGMDLEDQQRIFERFYRGKNAAFDGVGIGLSLAKKIVEMDQGVVKVTSEQGKGSVFEIRYEKI